MIWDPKRTKPLTQQKMKLLYKLDMGSHIRGTFEWWQNDGTAVQVSSGFWCSGDHTVLPTMWYLFLTLRWQWTCHCWILFATVSFLRHYWHLLKQIDEQQDSDTVILYHLVDTVFNGPSGLIWKEKLADRCFSNDNLCPLLIKLAGMFFSSI